MPRIATLRLPEPIARTCTLTLPADVPLLALTASLASLGLRLRYRTTHSTATPQSRIQAAREERT